MTDTLWFVLEIKAKTAILVVLYTFSIAFNEIKHRCGRLNNVWAWGRVLRSSLSWCQLIAFSVESIQHSFKIGRWPIWTIFMEIVYRIEQNYVDYRMHLTQNIYRGTRNDLYTKFIPKQRGWKLMNICRKCKTRKILSREDQLDILSLWISTSNKQWNRNLLIEHWALWYAMFEDNLSTVAQRKSLSH